MRLKVGDIILDSYRDEVIAQNYAVNQLGDIVTRQGSYSNDFELPLTAKNRDVLGYPEDMNSNNRNPYKKVSATLIDQGAPISDGYLRYKRVGNNSLRCAFFASNVEWFSLIKDKRLSDIDLSDFDHDWTAANIKTAIDANKSSGYTYPLIDYGEFRTLTDLDVEANQMYPAMFVHTLVEKMFFDVGWKVDGEMIDHPLYKRMVIPFSAKSFGPTEEFIEDNAISVTLPSNQDFTFGSVDLVWELPSTTDIDITLRAEYNLSFIIDYIDAVGIARFILLLDGSVILDQKDVLSDSGQVRLDATASLVPGDVITVRVLINDPSHEVTVISGSTFGTITPSENFVYGATITMSSTMPDITQADLLKYLVFLFGAIPQANNNSKTVTFSLFRSVKNNLTNAVDWSNKLDMSQTREIDFTELLNSYAQVSIMTYKEDENDAELSAYEAETGKRFGQGQFDIENEHLSSRDTIYEAPFSPIININSFTNTFYIPQIRYKDQSGGDDDVEPVPKIAILSTNKTVTALSGGLYSSLTINIPDTASSVSVSSLPFCWFAKTSFVSSINAIKDTLAFDQVQFPNAVGDPIIDRFLVDYEDIFNSLRGLEAWFKLDENDIASLDFSRPVYVDRFKAFFYISRIKNYQGGHKTTECEIVKISKSVEDLVELTPGNVFIDVDLQIFIDNDGESFEDAS